jgi:hypothetical protein
MRWLLCLAACTSSTLPAGSDLAVQDLARNPHTPLHHRVDDSACASAPPAGNCNLMPGFAQCNMDSQCTTGKNGRCIENMGGALTCFCSYDGCGKDGDCTSGQLCVCHGSPYAGGAGNTCMSGNCRTDTDCPGSYCSPSANTQGCGGLGGYYCHTAGDQCVDDGDCPTTNGPQFCAWSSQNLRWQCAPELLCP